MNEKGFKAFNADWTTMNNTKFKKGQTYSRKGKPIICQYGFHFCKELKNCFLIVRCSF